MAEPRVADGSSRTAMGRASDGRPFKPYVYRGGEREPGPVTAVRLRYRAHQAALDAMAAGEAMPDAAPGYEWKRELDDGDEVAETGAACDRYQDAMAAVPEPDPPPPVTSAGRCGRCGYLTTAAGHRVMCHE